MDFGQLGLHTGSVAWRDGHTAIRSGALRLPRQLINAPIATRLDVTTIRPDQAR